MAYTTRQVYAELRDILRGGRGKAAYGARQMNYDQAKMIANSPDCYSVEDWEKSASLLLGRLAATSEDIDDGTVLANRVAVHRTAGRYGWEDKATGAE